MTKRKTSKVSIDIYDADGVLCECIGGQMDYEDVKEQLLSIIGNDGIPVIRVHGKHEKVEEKHDHPVAVPSWEQPMTVSIEYQGARFLATGKYEDVMDAQAEFLEAVKCGGGVKFDSEACKAGGCCADRNAAAGIYPGEPLAGVRSGPEHDQRGAAGEV